jgi:peptidoglycan/xylan/chitin deacetylase (PgdA/CDA1 family)
METRHREGADVSRLITLMFHDVYEHSPAESGFRGGRADRYKLSLMQFRRQLRSIAGARDDAPVLVTDSGWPGDPMRWAVSFDDGGVSFHSAVAPALAGYGWRGHCLVTTDRLGHHGFLHPHHIREIQAAGHLIGTHSASHPARFDACPWDRLIAEWSRSRTVLEDLTGTEVVLGSVPGGYYTRRVAQAAQAAGLRVLLTSEPRTAEWRVGDCRVLGRYALRRDSPPDLAGRLVRRRPLARLRQWTAWNAKKVLKKSLGNGYIRLSGRIAG